VPIKHVLLFALGVALIASMPLILIAAIPPAGPMLSPVSSPVSVVALESVPPNTPAGPTVQLTLQNVGSTPIANLSAVLTLQHPYTFYFPNITSTSPLAGGQTVSISAVLFDAGFVCGTAFPLEIIGTFLGRGISFDLNVSHVLTCE
jgi:hypothetical protein